MVSSLHSIGFSCIVFLALQQVATGLLCYVCNDCSSVSSSTLTYNATFSGAVCMKTTISASGVTTVARAASISCKQGTVGGLSTYCCSTDLCNGSGSLRSSLLLALVLTTFATMSKMILIN